ncbi:MAG: hypothetical protein H6581_16715 [Bacteroidia bacterium]|nr:hypothetical protein [Bacteroidia bacterium]
MKYQTDPVKKNPLAPETVEGDTLGQTQAPPAFEVAADSITPPPNDSLGTGGAVEGTDSLATHPLDSLGNTGRDSLPPFDPAKKDTVTPPQPPKPESKTSGKGLLGQDVGLGKANDPQDVYALMYRLEEIGFLTVDDWQAFGADKTSWEANGMQGPFPDSAIGKIIWRYQETIGVIAPDGYITPGLEKGTEAALIEGKGGTTNQPKTTSDQPKTTNPLSQSEQTVHALSPNTPDYECIAREIFEAGQGLNTDEERIYTHLGMIEGGGKQAEELKRKFCELYDTDLETYLKKELWDVFGLGEESKALEMLNGEVNQPTTKDKKAENPRNQDARSIVIERANEYVAQNPGNSYGFDKFKPIPDPGEGKIDCSGLVRACIIASGYPDPMKNKETGKDNPGFEAANGIGTTDEKGKGTGRWLNGVSLLASNPDWQKLPLNEVENGDLAIFKTNRSDHQGDEGEFDHIGIITSVNKDEEGNLISFDFIHSFLTAPKGPQKYSYKIDEPKSWLTLMGAYKWDYVKD